VVTVVSGDEAYSNNRTIVCYSKSGHWIGAKDGIGIEIYHRSDIAICPIGFYVVLIDDVLSDGSNSIL
jgi:hypothetical protein